MTQGSFRLFREKGRDSFSWVRLLVRSPVTRRWVIHENPRERVAHASSLHEASNTSFTIHFTGRSTKFRSQLNYHEQL